MLDSKKKPQMSLSLKNTSVYQQPLATLPNTKLLITTINAHSYNLAQNDTAFAAALKQSDVLLPDGVSIVLAKRLLNGLNIKKIAGADLFAYEMERMAKTNGKCFFLGSSVSTLAKITAQAAKEYPTVKIATYSPPFKAIFSETDNNTMLAEINAFNPDVLFVGMTAPKQEKWAATHFNRINAQHIGCIGAVFDFYAGTVKRAPTWMINLGLEWLYRFLSEPQRLWKRYLLGNVKFVSLISKEKIRG